MDAIADRTADRAVSSIFIYSREAHPGEIYRHHATMDDKRHHAKALRDDAGIRRRILLDDIDLVETGPGIEVVFRPGGQIVHDGDVMAAADQRVHDVGGNEASSSSHKYPHGWHGWSDTSLFLLPVTSDGPSNTRSAGRCPGISGHHSPLNPGSAHLIDQSLRGPGQMLPL